MGQESGRFREGGEENGEEGVAKEERDEVPWEEKENDGSEGVGSVESIMIGGWGKVEFVNLGVRAKWALYQRRLRFEKRFTCEAGFELLPCFRTTFGICYGTLGEGMRNTAGTWSRAHRCKASYLATGVVDVQTP